MRYYEIIRVNCKCRTVVFDISVKCFFLAVPLVGLLCTIVVLPGHTH